MSVSSGKPADRQTYELKSLQVESRCIFFCKELKIFDLHEKKETEEAVLARCVHRLLARGWRGINYIIVFLELMKFFAFLPL